MLCILKLYYLQGCNIIRVINLKTGLCFGFRGDVAGTFVFAPNVSRHKRRKTKEKISSYTSIVRYRECVSGQVGVSFSIRDVAWNVYL